MNKERSPQTRSCERSSQNRHRIANIKSSNVRLCSEPKFIEGQHTTSNNGNKLKCHKTNWDTNDEERKNQRHNKRLSRIENESSENIKTKKTSSRNKEGLSTEEMSDQNKLSASVLIKQYVIPARQ